MSRIHKTPLLCSSSSGLQTTRLKRQLKALSNHLSTTTTLHLSLPADLQWSQLLRRDRLFFHRLTCLIGVLLLMKWPTPQGTVSPLCTSPLASQASLIETKWDRWIWYHSPPPPTGFWNEDYLGLDRLLRCILECYVAFEQIYQWSIFKSSDSPEAGSM